MNTPPPCEWAQKELLAGNPDDRCIWIGDQVTHYWQTCTSERMLTAFIPFHDCGAEMGTITMIGGSNHWREIEGDDSTRHFDQRDREELDAILHETAPGRRRPRTRAGPRPSAR
jgi:hypothetical protein